ncbi:MAG: glycosyltransferase family 4 protein [Muribaculaceae bacterium]|nr:glycosyltransferase family 4 protein [Muribaculaceae bacterium]
MKKRVIHIVESNRWTPTAQYALNVCVGLAREGVETLVYTRDAKVVDTPFRNAGIQIRHIPLGGYLDFPSVFLLARDFRKEEQGTVIHVHRYRDAFIILLARKLARRKDIRVIHTRHKIQRAFDTWLLRRVYRNLDAQIFISQMARDRFLSTWDKEYPFDASRLHVIFTSLSTNPLSPLPFKERGPVTAMYCGSLEPGKGLEILIDAIYRLREVKGRLRIYGSGNPDYVDSLRRRAQARGVMEMIDWKKDDGHPEESLRECDFGVMPSVRPEVFGVSNLLFLAAGRPIVATNNGAQTEYLRDGVDSILVPPANAAALGDALVAIASDAALRHSMGEAAFNTFRHRLSWPHFRRSLFRLYFPKE